MTTILLFLVILSVLVVFHEFGHYAMARIFGVKAEEFGLGFPPRAIGFVRDGLTWKRVASKDTKTYPNTIWSFNWLPLGGFVRLKGEQDAKPGDQDSFASKSVFARAWILLAGVLMNWVFAILVFTIGYAVGVPADLDGVPTSARVNDKHVEITQVVEGSPAARAGIRTGDRIIQIQNQTASEAEQVRKNLSEQSAANPSFTLTVERTGKKIDVIVTPVYVEALKKKGIGVGLADIGTVQLPIHRAFVQGITTTYFFTKMVVLGFWQMLRELFVSHRTGAQLSGPVGIAVMTGKIAEQGFWALAQFAALLSINLAVVNLLPIPALDGGRLVFVLLELIRRTRKTFSWEARAHQIGFILLISLIIFVTVRDVSIYGAPLWQGIKHFFYESL